jgi:CAAX prenyl protease-like protein
MPQASSPIPAAKAPVDTNTAFCVPFVLFAVLFAGVWLLDGRFGEDAPIWLREPAFLVYPLQTVIVGGALIYFRKAYKLPALTPLTTALGLVSAALVMAVWLAPHYVFGQPERLEGFDPTKLEGDPLFYWSTLILRFIRLVIVVPFMEEIFWRGWLQRRLIEEDVDEVKIGQFTWISYLGVAFLFGLAHWPADFWPAVVTGLLWNALIVRTRNLTACILSHAVINLALGLWILWSRQWGYW